MINFQTDISFSKGHSDKRIQEAGKYIGLKTVHRIIALALFFLGGNREQISGFLQMPVGTFFSLLTRFPKHGIDALIDKREKKQSNKASPGTARKIISKTEIETPETLRTINGSSGTVPCLEIVCGTQRIALAIPTENNRIIVKPSNTLQFKTLILSFMNSGFLTAKDASESLGLSQRHVRTLSDKLESDDVEALTDKRTGQKKDYIFTEEIKAELIQQYVVSVVTGGATSSSNITSQLNKICNSNISERAVRHHEAKLGLNKIKHSLPKLLKDLKKNP